MDQADDLYDPNAYVFDFPVWLVRNNELMVDPTLHPFSAFAKGVASFEDGTEDREYLAFFTDQDLAERFIKEHGLQHCEVDEISRDLFLALLSEARRFGINYVGLDAGAKKGRIVPISAFGR